MKVLLVLSLLLLSGCGNIKRWWSGISGDPAEYCHKGVKYLQFPSGVTVQYKSDGTVAKCEIE